jgi:hypothetical protein
MYIDDAAIVTCREPFELTEERQGRTRIDRMRVEHYRVLPKGPYGHGGFTVVGVGPVLTQSGEVHKGRKDTGRKLDVANVPDYVFEEAIEYFMMVRNNMVRHFNEHITATREARAEQVRAATTVV